MRYWLVAYQLSNKEVISEITDFADQNQMTQFMKNITIAGGFVFLVTHGAGNFSLDNRKID